MSIAEITRPAAPAPVDVAPIAWTARIHPAGAVVAVILLIMPLLANGFILFQIFSWAFILGMIGLSLMFLAGYGGMVSLAQMTIAGFSGYMVAIFGVSGLSGGRSPDRLDALVWAIAALALQARGGPRIRAL